MSTETDGLHIIKHRNQSPRKVSRWERKWRHIKFDIWRWIRLKPLRGRFNKWKRCDRREKDYWGGNYKYAINRDGDYFLVECPSCGRQRLYRKGKVGAKFTCGRCDVIITVYQEDGVIHIIDHRAGNVAFPARAVFDPAAKVYRLGIDRDAPWWWRRYRINRDLHGSRDAHGHAEYEVSRQEFLEEAGLIPEQCEKK